MKTLLYAVLIVCTSIFLVSCKKEDASSAPLSLVGKWELRKLSGGLGGGNTTYPPGNGRIIIFTETNFVSYENNVPTDSGTYFIEKDTTNTPPGNYFLYKNGKKFGLWLEQDRFFYWDLSISDYYYITNERI